MHPPPPTMEGTEDPCPRTTKARNAVLVKWAAERLSHVVTQSPIVEAASARRAQMVCFGAWQALRLARTTATAASLWLVARRRMRQTSATMARLHRRLLRPSWTCLTLLSRMMTPPTATAQQARTLCGCGLLPCPDPRRLMYFISGMYVLAGFRTICCVVTCRRLRTPRHRSRQR